MKSGQEDILEMIDIIRPGNLSSNILYKTCMRRICRTIIFWAVFYRYEMQSLPFNEEQKLRVFENKELRI